MSLEKNKQQLGKSGDTVFKIYIRKWIYKIYSNIILHFFLIKYSN